MPVKIRLMRIGTKKHPFYRVVAADERRKRTGKYLELLGTYNPLTEPAEIVLNKERIQWWAEHGAVLSDGYLRMTKQAPQKPPRKPKKEKQSDQKVKEKSMEVASKENEEKTQETKEPEEVVESSEEVKSEEVQEEAKDEGSA